MSVWLKKAEELLQSADRRAGAELERVKERVGITPVVDDPEADDCSSALGASVVVLSAAAGALLDPEERQRLIDSGTATIEDEREPATPAVASAADADSGDAATDADPSLAARRQRVAEWSALQQELQILSMHGRKLQGKLNVCMLALQSARAAEADAKRQLAQSLSARSAAEQAASVARGAVGEQRSASDARVAAAEARAAAAAAATAEAEAVAERLEESLALARAEASRSEEAAALQTATLAAVRLELSAEREQAETAAQATARRLAHEEALNAEVSAAQRTCVISRAPRHRPTVPRASAQSPAPSPHSARHHH